ncbi:MAG TPA: hypothetical protein VLE94_09150 [Burkholderiaceae bacterium]|nr:hypothetical protein [Burkholderiaceae bacterium]
MPRPPILLAASLVAFPALGAQPAAVPQRTVCTITVNSPDEKEAFRAHLPASKYRFVELVERGRPDWLASACRASVSCDVLIISAHYDGGNEFFSDQLDVNESLTVTELERVSCSDSCPSLFSRLKEVYLFGCNTLNPEPQSGASAEIVRSLVREGHSPQEAKRQLHALRAAHGESSRDRMRQIFNDVPVIYGFSSTAPLGPIAGTTLERYFHAGGARDVAQGRASNRLLGYFASFGMTTTPGITGKDPGIEARADMCQFADDRLSTATKLAFVHELLQRHIGEARLQLERIQRLTATLDGTTRREPAVAGVLEEIARDDDARERFLDYARRADQPPVRVRLLNVAHDVGWLSDDERRAELAAMLREVQARAALGVPDVNFTCTLNHDRRLDGALNRQVAPASLVDDVAHAAVRACLGSTEDRARTLQALLSNEEADVRIAQAYLRHRPITDPVELRRFAQGIAGMPAGEAQVRALEALARHYVSDPLVLEALTQLYARTPSWAVQAAIAGILIRADRRAISGAQLLRTLQDKRLPAPAGQDEMIDALIHRLQAS